MTGATSEHLTRWFSWFLYLYLFQKTHFVLINRRFFLFNGNFSTSFYSRNCSSLFSKVIIVDPTCPFYKLAFNWQRSAFGLNYFLIKICQIVRSGLQLGGRFPEWRQSSFKGKYFLVDSRTRINHSIIPAESWCLLSRLITSH
jgi:hypothetical protein